MAKRVLTVVTGWIDWLAKRSMPNKSAQYLAGLEGYATSF
jgi:hypothetical protein